MQAKTLLLAAVSITSVLAGTSNLKAPKRNEVNLILTREGDDLCCNQDIEKLKDLEACHKCRPWQKPDTTATSITSDTTGATTKRVEDKSTPRSSQPIDTLTWVTTHKPHVPAFTPLAKARGVTIMVDPSTHPHPQPNTTSTSAKTCPSGPVLPLCMEGGNVVPAKPLPEPWCSNANKQFQCQFCSYAYQLPFYFGNSLTKDLIEQDFEVWTVKHTLGDLAKIAKEDADIQSRDTPPIKPCCIWGGKPQWDCDNCRSTEPAANPPLSQRPKTLDTRKQNDICCYFNGVSTCYVCDAGQEPPTAVDGEVTVWSRKQALGGDTYEHEMVSDGKSGVANDMQVKQCCIVFRGFSYCFNCPSATSATEVSQAAATAANLAMRDSNDIKPAQRCWTNGLIVFDCHDCDKTPARSVNNDGRVVLMSVTTKVPATATKPMPTLSFPTTLTNLPQVTPPVAATLEKRSDQTKCCNTHDIVRCHNCSSEEDAALDSVAAFPTTNERNQCCVHLGDEMFCHHCPSGMADSTEYQETSTTLSVAKRQQTYDFHMSCSSSDQEQGYKCDKDDKLKVNAYMCPNICQCDNLGSMHCQTPSGSSCSDGETTDYCRKGSPYFGCACTHVSDHPGEPESTYPPRPA